MYIVECNDGTLYTGITTNLIRRINEHNGLSRGASYTRARRPVTLMYQEQHGNRSEASRREWHIKRLPRRAKQRLVQSFIPG